MNAASSEMSRSQQQAGSGHEHLSAGTFESPSERSEGELCFLTALRTTEKDFPKNFEMRWDGFIYNFFLKS